jgi:hypothetical protein
MRPVVDLLVEQVECADFVLLNKVGGGVSGGVRSRTRMCVCFGGGDVSSGGAGGVRRLCAAQQGGRVRGGGRWVGGREVMGGSAMTGGVVCNHHTAGPPNSPAACMKSKTRLCWTSCMLLNPLVHLLCGGAHGSPADMILFCQTLGCLPGVWIAVRADNLLSAC